MSESDHIAVSQHADHYLRRFNELNDKKCQADEIDHKTEASELQPSNEKTFSLNCWLWLINWGSKQAVEMAKIF